METREKLAEMSVDALEGMLGWVERSADKVGQGVDAAGAFVVEQTPLYIKEYLAWVFWGNAIIVITAVLAMLIVIGMAFLVARLLCNHAAENDGERAAIKVITPILTFLACTLIAFGNYDHVLKAVKVKVAPRVVIVEHLTDFVKNQRR